MCLFILRQTSFISNLILLATNYRTFETYWSLKYDSWKPIKSVWFHWLQVSSRYLVPFLAQYLSLRISFDEPKPSSSQYQQTRTNFIWGYKVLELITTTHAEAAINQIYAWHFCVEPVFSQKLVWSTKLWNRTHLERKIEINKSVYYIPN